MNAWETVLAKIFDLEQSHGSIHQKLDLILQKEGIEVSGLSDLNANLSALQAEWSQFLSDLTTALQNEDSDAAVEAAAQLVAQQTAAIAAEDAIVNPPAPAPAPSGD